MNALSYHVEAGNVKEIFIGSTGMTFCWCPAGSFLMGSPLSELERMEDEEQHQVTFKIGFWIQQTPFTQEQYLLVGKDNKSIYLEKDFPVDNVNWFDCMKICNFLNSMKSDFPDYEFRLPSEQQWEYACRAGTSTPFNFGSVLNGYQANHNGNYPYGTKEKGPVTGKTTAVKSYLPNAWNIYDMHGNVWEWCCDYYGKRVDVNGYMPRAMIKGGSWFDNAISCRSAFRISEYLDQPASDERVPGRNGFRLVLNFKDRNDDR